MQRTGDYPLLEVCSNCKTQAATKALRHRHKARRCENCDAQFQHLLNERKAEVMKTLRKFVTTVRLQSAAGLRNMLPNINGAHIFNTMTFKVRPGNREVRWRVNGVQQVWIPKKDCDSQPYFDYLHFYPCSFRRRYHSQIFARQEMIALLALRKRVPSLAAVDRNVFRLIFHYQSSIY